MTAPALASLALKYYCPGWPIRVERLRGAHFRITAFPKLPMPTDGTRDEKIHAIMVSINEMLEAWIRDRPEQWLWLHRRWPR
jgi:KDO2-lipid IV(A) lauroyltransferase